MKALEDLNVTNYRDSLGRYYTKEIISNLLVSELSIEEPRTILDLGCGDGSLSKAALTRWNKARFVTVDIDIEKKPLNENSLDPSNHSHFVCDALSSSLIKDIGLSPGSVDLAVCNPPFLSPRWRYEYEEILTRAGFTSNLKKIQKSSAEIIFIAQNLNSLKNGGQLGLIVPDGIISGRRNSYFREQLLNLHTIKTVIKLPRDVFVGTEAQAHILIISKGREGEQKITLKDFSSGTFNGEPIHIDANNALHSLDYDFHCLRSSLLRKNNLTVEDLNVEIKRGCTNSKKAKISDVAFLHTTDIHNFSPTLVLDEYNQCLDNEVYAEPGDLIMARVGRNLHTKICIIKKGRMPITDCLFRIRGSRETLDRIYKTFCSEYGQAFMKAMMRGVSAKHITLSSLKNFPII